MQADKWMRRCVGRVGDDARFQNFRHTDTDGKVSTVSAEIPSGKISPLTVMYPVLKERTNERQKNAPGRSPSDLHLKRHSVFMGALRRCVSK